MLSIVCNIWQNLGSSSAGATSVLTGKIAKLGKLTQTIDDQLTKMSPGEMTVEVEDPDDSIWAFVQGQLTISNGLFPPYLQVIVGGAQVFLGIVDPSRIVRHLAADLHSIEFGAQDWSVELANTFLGCPSAAPWLPSTAYVVGQQALNGGNAYQCITAGTSATSVGPAGTVSPISDGTVVWAYIAATWVRPVPSVAANRPATIPLLGYSANRQMLMSGLYGNEVIFYGPPNSTAVGDTLTCDACGTTVFTALNVQSPPDPNLLNGPFSYNMPWPNATLTQVSLDKSPWGAMVFGASSGPGVGLTAPNSTMSGPYPITFPDYANFVRQATASTDQSYFVVTQAVGASPSPAQYFIMLNSVDGIVAGDVLRCIHGTQAATWTVMSINPELLQIVVSESVTNLGVGDRIYFDDATNAEMVMVDARVVLTNAAYPFRCDQSRLVQASTPSPVFGWLPMVDTGAGANLMAISDMEPTLTGARVYSGLTTAYDGTPDGGWFYDSTFPATRNADWTGQRITAPASLMPYEVAALAQFARLRNRTYHDFNWLGVDNGPVITSTNPIVLGDAWTPSVASQTPAQLFYDYLGMRKLTVIPYGTAVVNHYTISVGSTVTATAWTGTAWGSSTVLTWPSPNTILGVCNFPGGPAGAILAYTVNNLGGNPQLELAFAGATVAPIAIPASLLNAVLVPTPYGPYLIGAMAYGQITYTGGVLGIAMAAFAGIVTAFWPNTFVAISSTQAVIMGRLDSASGSVDNSTGNLVTETWLYTLSLTPSANTTNPVASIISSESIASGVPVFAGAIADPSKPGRVIGHYGGRIWQFGTTMPWTIERFTPSGMTALECIEHVCQLLNAMAVPQPSGTLAIVSRGIVETPVALTCLMVKNDQARSWPNFYSIVRCTTQDQDFYYDAYGQVGGQLLTIAQHPMLWVQSQAAAMAQSYIGWFGQPRRTESHTWTWPDATTAPPWQGLPPFARVTVDGTGPWRVMSTTQDFIEGTCDAVLVEAP